MKLPDMLTHIILILFFLCGCNNNAKEKQEEETINSLDPVIIDVTQVKETKTPLKLSQFADSISYIRLSEYDSEFSMFETAITIIDDTIFLDNDNLHKYTPEGKFIKKIFNSKQNRIEARKVSKRSAFNKKERNIAIRTYSKSSNSANFKYELYSFDGVYVGESKYELENRYKIIETYFDNYCIYRIDTIASANTKINRLGQNLFYAENIETNSVFYSYPNPASKESFPFHDNSDYLPGNMNFISLDSVLWFKHFVIDTLYCTKDFVTIQPRYIFKTDESFMTLSDYTQLKNGVLDENRLKKLNKIWGVLPLPATENILFTINRSIAIADKSGNITGCTMQPVINDLDEYLKNIDIAMYIIERFFYVENNYLYLLIAAESFFKEGCKPPFENLTEKSNPIVLKIKLKS